MLGEFTASSGPHGSQMDIKGWTRKYDNIAEMEEGVRALAGNMNTKDSHEDRIRLLPTHGASTRRSLSSEESGKEPAKTRRSAKPPQPPPRQALAGFKCQAIIGCRGAVAPATPPSKPSIRRNSQAREAPLDLWQRGRE